jgi:hypothetical protein
MEYSRNALLQVEGNFGEDSGQCSDTGSVSVGGRVVRVVNCGHSGSDWIDIGLFDFVVLVICIFNISCPGSTIRMSSCISSIQINRNIGLGGVV